MIRLYKPTLSVCQEVEKIFTQDTYNISLVEYEFVFHCFDEYKASQLCQFLKESYHLSNLKKLSLTLEKYSQISYRANPRKTRTKANRIYIKRNDLKAPKLEYVIRRKWLRDNGIKSILDCFLVSPMLVTQNSSFRVLDYHEIEKKLKRFGMKNNIAARYVNRGKEILKRRGFHAAYRHFSKHIDKMSKVTYAPLHPFHETFMSSIEKMTFLK